MTPTQRTLKKLRAEGWLPWVVERRVPVLRNVTQDMFGFMDDLGPEKIVHISNPAAGLKAIVVVDNTAAGPAIGGTRMATVSRLG